MQYRLAGLDLDEEIPKVKGFPHRGLPSGRTDIARQNVTADVKGKGKEVIKGHHFNGDQGDGEDGGRKVDVQDEETKREEPPPRLRLQHLAVLTAILQRCLLEGDIPRASRAWAMLVRAQVGGRGMDLRASGYWAIGAELLIRSGEKPRKPRSNGDADGDDGDDEHQEVDQRGERYGTAAGLEKAKEYYERLILHIPYIRHYPHSISALDFWPAMVGCEIYGIQCEQKESLRKIASDEENEDKDGMESRSDSELEIAEAENDDNDLYALEERGKARKHRKRTDKVWQERDQIRKTALEAYEKLAARLDELMQNLPYMDNQALLRLRAMLALCIGDLMVPALPADDEGADERVDRGGIDGNHTERRFLLRQRVAEHERGKKQQREEHILARAVFERIERTSGRKEVVTDSLPHPARNREDS